ncbi:MAG: hypothetical protein RO469_07590 [Thermincola sp.]|nr:hypothetical protein [Thermincola sp.]MDT3704506.1 hypothetical protein [Thermincola sp.]
MDKIPANLLEAVKNAATDGKLSCVAAHSLAEKLGVELIMVGKAADELKIKIKDCQLGCF